MCPTCDQNIDSNVKEHKHTEAKTRAKFLQEEIREVDDQLATLNNSISKLTDQLKVADMIDSEGTKIMNLRQNVSRMMVEYQKDLDQIGDTHGDLKGANKTLSCMIEDRTSLFDEKATLAESKSYYDAIFEMLRDTGIKTKIIKQYLPAMNKLINHYLQALDFFVSFNIDESFQEEIRSRYRDTFNYASFSEGEKQRIDLALLFTWRKVAAMKNSASTNLLVLDETFDSSLDTEGIENLMKILDTIDDGTNTFIISHKGDVLESKFENKIEFVTHNNFSEARI
jgi:DNA repair exonuclease SbcCD ATPase subunit